MYTVDRDGAKSARRRFASKAVDRIDASNGDGVKAQGAPPQAVTAWIAHNARTKTCAPGKLAEKEIQIRRMLRRT